MPIPPPPREAALAAALAREGGSLSRWSNGPGAVYPMHEHPYRKILIVAEGSITFTLQDGQRVVPLQPGDRLEVPPGTPHSAHVGPDGVVCLEAHIA